MGKAAAGLFVGGGICETTQYVWLQGLTRGRPARRRDQNG